VELGFGKGRYLLQKAAANPTKGFLGVEVAGAYYRLVRQRMCKRGLGNVVLLRGEALYLLATVLPGACADAVHAYFPDPWPKARHQRRRLFDAESIDLVLSLLREGGRLFFATDYLEYGMLVQELLRSHPALEVETLQGLWSDGARTNYEAKYERQGRPILRLIVKRLAAPSDLIHPDAAAGVVAAVSERSSPREVDGLQAASPGRCPGDGRHG
jgi:tRNA (guanine-N7-)-methyltransferase